MGVVSAFLRAIGVDVGVGEAPPSLPAVRTDPRVEQGMKHMLACIEGLAELDTRLARLHRQVAGARGQPVGELPDPYDLGLDGKSPRVMEAAHYIGALSRRMHVRMSVIEAVANRRARALAALKSPVALKGKPKPRALPSPAPTPTARHAQRPRRRAELS